MTGPVDPSPEGATRAQASARIDAAISRIEAALARQTKAADTLRRRHATLKTRMAEAVKALDEVIARSGPDGGAG